MHTAFGRLFCGVATDDALTAAYETVLSALFARPLWESGTVDLQRVPWSQGKRARTEDIAAFKSPGIYIWGVDARPLYIGKTLSSFGKRFSRYIWNPRSQCNLACDFEDSLIARGLDGFPQEVHEWYARFSRGSKVRLQGAVRFAEEGIGSVWSALFPHDTPSEISQLEKSLIRVAYRWNMQHGFRRLLNVNYISEGQS